MDKIKLQREKRAYLAYLVYLLRSRAVDCPMHFNSLKEMDVEIKQVEAHLVILDLKIKMSNLTIQLN